jgi:hypothetical protein
MVMDIKQVELNRIVDTIKIRGYGVTSSSIKDDQIVIEAQKIIPPELQATRDTESTWITNFLKSFGWVVQSTSYPEGKINITFSKTVVAAGP